MIVLLATLGALAAEPVPFADVAAQLSETTGGAIVPTPAAGRPDGFVVERGSPEQLVAAPERPPWLDQGLFELDVTRWLEHTGAPDFLESKRRFYADLDFLPYDQVHERPWPYLAAWQELFHPPIEQLELPLTAYSDLFGPQRPDDTDAPWFDPEFQQQLDDDTQTELTRDNELLLLDSDEAFHEKLRMVREAKESLYVSVMFFGCDETSNALAEAMKERAAAGVDVRLLTEGVYRASLGRRCADRMLLGGVRVASANAALQPGTAQAVLHYKVWIRDGEELIEGGSNILDYENLGNGTNFLDRDTDLHVLGPMVADAEEAYLLAWDAWSDDTEGDDDRLAAVRAEKTAQREAGDRGPSHYAAWLADPEQRTDGLCRLAMQNLMTERHAIAPLIEAYLQASRHQVVFVSPAMREDPVDPATQIGVLMSLIEERSGPDDPRLIVLSNGAGGGAGELGIWLRRNRWNLHQRGNRFWPPLLHQYQQVVSIRAGLRNRLGALALQRINPRAEVWMYFQHLHTKTWLFDRQVSVVGSWNLDENSADLNYENAVVCLDDGLRDALERDFTRALVNSIPVVSRNGM